MSIMEVTTRITRRYLEKKTKADLADFTLMICDMDKEKLAPLLNKELESQLAAKDEEIRKLREALQQYADQSNWEDTEYCNARAQIFTFTKEGFYIAEAALKGDKCMLADIEIKEAVCSAVVKHELSYCELIAILAGVIQSWTKSEVREQESE